MNAFDIFFSSLIFPKFFSLLVSFLIILVSFFIITSDHDIFSFSFSKKVQTNTSNPSDNQCQKKSESSENNKIIEKSDQQKNPKRNKKIKVEGFQAVNYSEKENKYYFSEITENISGAIEKVCSYYKQKLTTPYIKNKNDELYLMLTEALSSLNYSKKNDIEKIIFQKTNWLIEKKEEKADEERIVYQSIFPPDKFFKVDLINDTNINMNINENNNLSFSNSTINSFDETEDEVVEEESSSNINFLRLYKINIIREFNNNNNDNIIKTNIIKDLKDANYKIYSQGDPLKIKSICKFDTLPENYEEIVKSYNIKGKQVIALAGKIVKASYLQIQKITRKKSEDNLFFLGFIILNIS